LESRARRLLDPGRNVRPRDGPCPALLSGSCPGVVRVRVRAVDRRVRARLLDVGRSGDRPGGGLRPDRGLHRVSSMREERLRQPIAVAPSTTGALALLLALAPAAGCGGGGSHAKAPAPFPVPGCESIDPTACD